MKRRNFEERGKLSALLRFTFRFLGVHIFSVGNISAEKPVNERGSIISRIVAVMKIVVDTVLSFAKVAHMSWTVTKCDEKSVVCV